MKRWDLLAELKGRAVLCDGAMGTQLFLRGLATGACPELWNVERAGAVEEVHRAYREAGCELITTNTFGGSRMALERHGVGERWRELNVAGAKAARRGAGEEAFVLGDMGPFGGFLEPVGDASSEEVLAMFGEQAEALAAGGAQGFVVETMSDAGELVLAVKAAKGVGAGPVIATYSFARAEGVFRTMMGTGVREAMAAALEAGADVVGTNCGTSLSLRDYVELAGEILGAAGGRPVIVQANAGSPKVVEGKLVYAATAGEMAGMAAEMVKMGVKIVGGCCGTGPEHLRAMGRAMGGGGR